MGNSISKQIIQCVFNFISHGVWCVFILGDREIVANLEAFVNKIMLKFHLFSDLGDNFNEFVKKYAGNLLFFVEFTEILGKFVLRNGITKITIRRSYFGRKTF